jgi:tRNA (cytidine/uridine-2'-O-)-methyltransferase
VGPLGFRVDSNAVKRAGLDYWHLVELHRHLDFPSFRHRFPSARPWLVSARAERSYLDVRFEPGDALVFGRESVGLPAEWLVDHSDRVVGIPTLGGVRSLNLSNAVSIVLYEALRQVGALRDAVLR